MTYAQLRRAAVGVSTRLADGGIEPGEVVILLGRHSIEAAVAMLGCLHRGVVLAPLPPMFNETQMAALVEQTEATAIVSFGGDKEIAKCREVAGDRLALFPILPDDVDSLGEQDLPDDRTARHADDLAVVLHSSGTTSAPKGIAQRRLAMKEAFGVPPLGDYGLSEVPGHAAHAPDDPEDKILTTEGRPYDGTEIRIVGADGQALPAGEVGSVIVNGPSRFLGFLNNDDLTRESLTDWGGYRTGDLGSLDEDGQFIYVGRSKDIIRRGGVTIVPAEVEPVILRHPAVQEVAIVPLPDDRLGERACAAIIARPGHTAPTLPELQEFLDTEGVAKYTWPESVQVFDEFPRTPSLKVVKRDVVQLLLERSQVTA